MNIGRESVTEAVTRLKACRCGTPLSHESAVGVTHDTLPIMTPMCPRCAAHVVQHASSLPSGFRLTSGER